MTSFCERVHQVPEILHPPDDALVAMDEDVYEEILQKKGIYWNPKEEPDDSDEELLAELSSDEEMNRQEMGLRRDFAAGKVRWYGDWWKDMWAFQRNQHPVIAMCCSHPNFPVSRIEFYWIFGVNVIFTLAMSTLAIDSSICVACNVGCGTGVSECYFDTLSTMNSTHSTAPDLSGQLSTTSTTLDMADMSGANGDPLPDGHGFRLTTGNEKYAGMKELDGLKESPSSDWCCFSERIGLNAMTAWFWDNGAKSGGKTLFCMVSGILYMIVFFNLMQCNGAQNKHFKERHKAEQFGHIAAGVVSLAILCGFLPPAFIYLHRQGLFLDMILLVIKSKLIGWCGVFFVKVFLFSVCHTKNLKQEQQAAKFYVTEQDFQEYADGKVTPRPPNQSISAKKMARDMEVAIE